MSRKAVHQTLALRALEDRGDVARLRPLPGGSQPGVFRANAVRGAGDDLLARSARAGVAAEETNVRRGARFRVYAFATLQTLVSMGLSLDRERGAKPVDAGLIRPPSRRDPVAPLALFGARGLDRQPELLADGAADEAAHGVGLPSGGFHDPLQRR
jgi:hypothetical protein